eukprot:3936095-Rhodomonas_salina.1
MAWWCRGRCASLGLECKSWLKLAGARIDRVRRQPGDVVEGVKADVTLEGSASSQRNPAKRRSHEVSAGALLN